MMAEAAGGSEMITETVQQDTMPQQQPESRSLTIKLRKRKTDKKVEWSSDTVDNEHLGRRSSKCCCIYEKRREFGESSTESEDEEDGCGNAHCVRGHRDKHGNMQKTPTPTPQPESAPSQGGEHSHGQHSH
ncbi:E3 ubiquitin-protein ligase PPP1R11 [Acipenser oxyrinchus oxyrinchus]|uniref:E3 ubiquitin-protein ligase PPP1R11 n=1 Tax=Acipenser oxyrinchus oxyrinchus TaxID=40147 RepID=A0AAD8FVY4_ACIOX|nr:E3 ubiquitin-protein ligase PPP1R11 [Acipenser oxyrinchus oxyrinchus]